MRISDWSSDVCSSDLAHDRSGQHRLAGARLAYDAEGAAPFEAEGHPVHSGDDAARRHERGAEVIDLEEGAGMGVRSGQDAAPAPAHGGGGGVGAHRMLRSEEHTSEIQSLMRISYAVFCLKK